MAGDFDDGYVAARMGDSIGDSPYRPSDPTGAHWRQGFVAGTADLHQAAGTYGATPEDIDAARATLGPARVDVAAQLLEHPDGPDRDGQAGQIVTVDERIYWFDPSSLNKARPLHGVTTIYGVWTAPPDPQPDPDVWADLRPLGAAEQVRRAVIDYAHASGLPLDQAATQIRDALRSLVAPTAAAFIAVDALAHHLAVAADLQERPPNPAPNGPTGHHSGLRWPTPPSLDLSATTARRTRPSHRWSNR